MANMNWDEKRVMYLWVLMQGKYLRFLSNVVSCGFQALLILFAQCLRDVPPCAGFGTLPKLIASGGWSTE